MSRKRKSLFVVITIVFCIILVLHLSILKAATVVRLITAAGPQSDVLAGIIPDFQKKYSDIKIELTPIPYSVMQEKLMTQFIGAPGQFDLIAMIEPWREQFKNYLEPIDRMVTAADLKSLSSSPLDCSRWDGKLLGLPYRFGANILIYRKDLFEKYKVKVPTTWPEYLDAAKKLTLDTDHDGSIDIYGASLYAKGNVSVLADTYNVLWTWGGHVVEPDGKRSALLRPESIEAMNYYVDLYRKHRVVPPASIGWMEYEETIRAFCDGQIAMFISYSPRVLVVEDPAQSKVAGKLGYTTVPLKPGLDVVKTRPYYAVGWFLAMDKASRNKNSAFAFIKYASSFDAQKKMAIQLANGPIRDDVMSDPDYLKIFPKDAAEAIMQSFKYGTGRYTLKNTAAVDVIWAEAVADMLAGNTTVENAMRIADTKINEVLQR